MTVLDGYQGTAPAGRADGLAAWARASGCRQGRKNAGGGLRFVFYGRVSTEDWQDPATSRRRQREQAEALIRGHGHVIAEFFDAGQSRTVAWGRRPEAAALVAQLADPNRGWDAIVIGEYERAFYGSQYAMMAPLLQHYAIQLWMPEAGGRVDFASEHDERAMTVLGLSSKREVARLERLLDMCVSSLRSDDQTHSPAAERADLRKDGLVLSLDDFERLRREVCASGPASDGDNLLGMEIDFCAYLGDPAYADEDPGLWQNMIVRRHEGAQWLITGQAEGRRGDAAAISAELARIWEECLRYQDRAGHAIETAPDRVTLRAVTQIAPGELWVTATVQVDLA